MNRIGILAGGGRLPLMIAESAAARGESVHIVGIEGEADPAITRFSHTWVNWGQIGRMVATLRSQGGELVIAGGVTRPDLWKVRPDIGFFRSLPQIAALLAGGDDAVLTKVVRFFEHKGLRVRGAHEIAPDLLARDGRIGRIALSEGGYADARVGFAVRQVLGELDAGQAVAVAGGRVLAIEGAEGTDAMLQRAAALAARGTPKARRGVLAKGPKPGQELRVDMPVIGPGTVAGAVAANLEGIVVEAGAVLVLDREKTVAAADAAGCAVVGLASSDALLADAGGASWPVRSAQVLGRVRPNTRDTGDIDRGLAVVERLAPLQTGHSAVVARAHVLAIEAMEGVAGVLQRVSALRQWGDDRHRRRLGVLVRRVEANAAAGAVAPGPLLECAAAQGLAGIAVTGTDEALEAYATAVKLADDAGLFLVTCQTSSSRGPG